MAQKIHRLNAEFALVRVNGEPKLIQTLKQDPKVRQMILFRLTKHQQIVHVNEQEGKVGAKDVHHALEGVAGVPETKRSPQKLVQAKRSYADRLGNVIRVHRDLVVTLNEVQLGEDGRASQFLHKIVDVR